jgi:DNA recombination protein RmuC
MEIFISFVAGIFLGVIATLFIGLKNIYPFFLKEFENLSSKILKQNSEEFSRTNQKEILDLMRPFKEKILEFEQKIDKNRIDEIKELSSLEAQVKIMVENNQKICKEANNLANALKGQSKLQGNWGEILLERILEVCGLQKSIHYKIQESFRSDENKILRPDAVVYLPENRHIVIDSKVSLISYEKFFNSEIEAEKHLKEFLNSTKDHIKNLKNKFYQDIKEINSPDFVLMFIPIEACFNLIMQNDSEIFEFGWKNRVLPVTPSTLLAVLRSIEIFWQKESQSQNVIEIAQESGKLYDKFVTLLSEIQNIENHFHKSYEGFEELRRRLSGKNGLIGNVEKLRILGAKTTKKISCEFIEVENNISFK